MRGHEVACDVIEKRRFGRCDATFGDDVGVGSGQRFGGKRHGPNVPDIVESIGKAGAGQHPRGVIPAAIGEDEALARQRREDGIQPQIRLEV